ncbi:MAG: nucleotidyltransferase substrate binding protein [Deltaproteobacteria bacterium]|jgi:nucleotidyltransferase substrate binding protein (TIGR01987 family)|nr:nucleotidyltransferase substrate binding protein [Deltaproteobacteria bacterium]
MSENKINKKSFIIESNIEIEPLLNAYGQFNEALKIAKTDLEKAGTIQYFEFTYELAWKTLKRILSARGKELNSPKPIFREAALEKLIDDPELWFDFTKDRNETVHTYNKAIANSIFNDLHLFDKEMGKLISHLKALK